MNRKFGLVLGVGILSLCAMVGLLTANPVSAKQGGKVDTTKAMARAAGTPEKAVKLDSEVNKKGLKRPAPASKGGKKTRATSVQLHIDNRTAYYVRIYCNDEYEGTVGPYGDWYQNRTSGKLELYAVAKFDDGSRYTWGPRKITVNPSGYTWKLTE